jgi:hypothetical protein
VIIEDLIEAIRTQSRPPAFLDMQVMLALLGNQRRRWRFLLQYECPPATGFSYARVTAQIDVARALFMNVFPGWCWRVAECSISDDAWVMPDFNHPEHGERLQQLFPIECQRDPLEWFGTDIDLRPPGRPAAAFCISMLVAHQKTKEWMATSATEEASK